MSTAAVFLCFQYETMDAVNDVCYCGLDWLQTNSGWKTFIVFCCSQRNQKAISTFRTVCKESNRKNTVYTRMVRISVHWDIPTKGMALWVLCTISKYSDQIWGEFLPSLDLICIRLSPKNSWIAANAIWFTSLVVSWQWMWVLEYVHERPLHRWFLLLDVLHQDLETFFVCLSWAKTQLNLRQSYEILNAVCWRPYL